MKKDIIRILEANPLIAAIKDEEGLNKAIHSESDVVFVLYGNICTISSIVKKLKTANKVVLIDIDLIEGLAPKEISVDFIQNNTDVDGIISSKAMLIRVANNKGLFTIHRFFLIDSKSFRNLPKQVQTSGANIVEILPGAMPKVLKWVQAAIEVPVIASGLVCDKEDVLTALQAGAIAISSTNSDVWDNI